MNTAADFLSRLETDPNEKIILKIREDIPTKPIEVSIESAGIAQEELVFFDPTDHQKTTEKELWQRKKEARNAIPTEPRTTSHNSVMLLRKRPTQRHNNCEYSTIDETITYTYRTRFGSHITKFQTRNARITI